MSRKLRQVSNGYAAINVDIRHGDFFDIGRPAVVRVLRGWISSGRVRGVWMGFPCSTWSRARWPPLRTAEFLLCGTPEARANPDDLERLKFGNATFEAALALASACQRMGVPCMLENPSSSMAWTELRIKRLIHHPSASRMILDYCRFGKPWRKRTQLVGIHTGDCPQLNVRCRGKPGVCETGRAHQILRSSHPTQHIPWTKVAEPYPAGMARIAAKHLHAASDRQLLYKFFKAAKLI